MHIDRGMTGRLRRLPELDLESYHDFLTGFRTWMFRDLNKATTEHAQELTEREYAAGGNLSFERAKEIYGGDPVVAVSQRIWVSTQIMAHYSLLHGFQRSAEDIRAWFAEAEASDCGTITLDPDLDMPEYTKHEIHVQPGGYVGEEMAGPIYHYGTNSFYAGWNDQDEVYIERAKVMTKPADGKVARIIDLGSGIGQYPVALKEAFPDAEVWGIEVGEPLVRYAHARAYDLKVPIHSVQGLAEKTGFEDGFFDVVSAHILFHEVDDKGAYEIINEAYRILRPGGVFDIIDFNKDREFGPYDEFRLWSDHFYNGEPFEGQFYNRPFFDWLTEAGFEVSSGDAPLTRGGLKKYVARKPA